MKVGRIRCGGVALLVMIVFNISSSHFALSLRSIHWQRALSSYRVLHRMHSGTMSDAVDEPISTSKEYSIFHLKRTVDSTQDEAKRLLDMNSSRKIAVIADRQRHGRGTSGRSWVEVEGNLFLTCAVPVEAIPMSKITLLPLAMGVLISQRLAPMISSRPVLKWPNDVLVDGKKIAGTLIENYRADKRDFWLVGIGVNVNNHPEQLSKESKDFRDVPRSATCLKEYSNNAPEDLKAVDIGIRLSIDIFDWISNMEELQRGEIVSACKGWSALSSKYEIRETGEQVEVIDIESDGQLRVKDSKGEERLLVADYFY